MQNTTKKNTLHKFGLKHFLLSLLMLLSAGTAWADVEINETNFPDAEFRDYLLCQDYGSDGVLTDEERAAVVKMEVNSKEIQSLQGIEYFTALTYLDCYDNQLASLDVSKNTKLTELSCYSNQLTSLNVSGCIALEYLFCGWNQLASLDVSGCTALEELYCYSNQLTSLNVSGCTALTCLYCYQNQIKDEAMDALVESLPTSNDCEMRVVRYTKEKNVISFPQVAAARAKGWILYYEDRFTRWKECPWEEIEISEENFPDANFRYYLLTQSYGSDGKLTDEEIAGVTSIDVSYEEIQSLQGIEYFTALTDLRCYVNQLTSLDVSKNTALTTLWCYNNQLTSLDASGCTALTELFCGKNQLTSLDLSKNTALTKLNCYSNQLTSLDVSKNTALTMLYCNDNKLTSLDVSKNTKLTSLMCQKNPLTSLDVSKNTSLTNLYCNNNQLTSLDVSGCTALTYLNCSSNHLTSLDVSKNTVLTRLYCYQNRIKGAAMDALVASLPTVSYYDRTMDIIYYEHEQNVMTTTQVAAAKAKRWIPRYYDGNTWVDYAGVDPATGVNNVEAADADDSAPWYTVDGVELTEKPTAPGIYIHGGKKVIVK